MQKLFSNRDYVYQRRWIKDKEKGLVVIVSRVTEHPNVPERRGIYRYIYDSRHNIQECI